MEKIVINHCITCEPIMELLKFFVENKKFSLLEKYCKDPHFNEMYFKLLGKKDDLSDIPLIKNITQYSPTKYICECHWSTVDIELRDERI